MISVEVYADRNRVRDLNDLRNGMRNYPMMKCQLPFLPQPGDNFYPSEGWAGMSVLRREVTGNTDVITLIVDGNSWDLNVLKQAGFSIKLGE